MKISLYKGSSKPIVGITGQISYATHQIQMHGRQCWPFLTININADSHYFLGYGNVIPHQFFHIKVEKICVSARIIGKPYKAKYNKTLVISLHSDLLWKFIAKRTAMSIMAEVTKWKWHILKLLTYREDWTMHRDGADCFLTSDNRPLRRFHKCQNCTKYKEHNTKIAVWLHEKLKRK